MDRDTLISLAAYGVIFAGLGLAITMAIRIWHNRPRKPQPTLTVKLTAGTAELCAAFEALDRVVTALEQDEAYQREAALGNDVVSLRREIRPVREAREIIEREMAR